MINEFLMDFVRTEMAIEYARVYAKSKYGGWQSGQFSIISCPF